MASAVASQPTAPSRRRPRRKAPVAVTSRGRGAHTADTTHGRFRDRTTPAPPAPPALSPYPRPPATVAQSRRPRLWTLLHEAQEEMEHGTDILGDELKKLWRDVREVAEARIVDGGNDERRRDHGSRERNEAVVARQQASVTGGGVRGERQMHTRPTLPSEEVDALLGGLDRLRSEMEAEVKSFQKRKSDLLRRLTKLGLGQPENDDQRYFEPDGPVWGGDGTNYNERVALEEEAESMRAGVVASHARLLGRVRELQGLPRRHRAPFCKPANFRPRYSHASISAPTTAAADRTAGSLTATTTAAQGSSHSLDDLVDSAHAVLAAREELADLTGAIEAERNELKRERRRARAAGEQMSRLESLRSAAAAAANRARMDADKVRAETEVATIALDTAREGLAVAEVAQRKADDAAESEQRRLESLRREAAEQERRLRTAAREVEEREARAEVAAAAAQREEERLADCRDSFGLEIDGLQKGVGELESEALGWREVLKEARSRCEEEEAASRSARATMEGEQQRAREEIERLKVEAGELNARVRALRRRHESENDVLARDTRATADELEAVKSDLADARSALRSASGELQSVSEELQQKSMAVSATEENLIFLERRSTELAARISDLETGRECVNQEGEAARRRQGEELARWREIIAKRREEFEGVAEMVRDKAASLQELEGQTKAYILRSRQAQNEQETASSRAQAALRAAREAAALAERARDKADREEARAEAAEARTAEAMEQFRLRKAEMQSENNVLSSLAADIEEARRVAREAQSETERTRQDLRVLMEKRREEEDAILNARQRATILAREAASLQATAAAARREGGERREVVTAARGELSELHEAVDRERRALEGFRDLNAEVEAVLARKREEDRFAREAADAQQSRLDEIKREVTLLRDERLRVEMAAWGLKTELEALATKRDDAARRDRRREREESALAARRDALANAVASEEERLGLATAAKEALEAEVAEIGARAGTLTAEAGLAARETSALREDAATAAGRADDARRRTVALENETARLNSDAEKLRATKHALHAELDGLRHELNTLREDRGYSAGWNRANRRALNRTLPREEAAAQVQSVHASGLSPAHQRFRETRLAGSAFVPSDNVQYDRENFTARHEAEDEGVPRSGGREGNVAVDAAVAGSNPGSLVEVVAEFQGRLRQQVQAALASAGGGGTAYSRDSGGGRTFSRSDGEEVDLTRSKKVVADSSVGRRDGHIDVSSSRRRSSQNVLGELGRRVGSV